MTGTPNVSSSSTRTVGGNAADDERIKRSGHASTILWLASARLRIAWCIAGTAVYQLGESSRIQSKKRGAKKPGVQTTLAPVASDASSAAIKPWMWNNGMTFRQRSCGDSRSVAPMLRAEAQTLACVSGTIL